MSGSRETGVNYMTIQIDPCPSANHCWLSVHWITPYAASLITSSWWSNDERETWLHTGTDGFHLRRREQNVISDNKQEIHVKKHACLFCLSHPALGL